MGLGGTWVVGGWRLGGWGLLAIVVSNRTCEDTGKGCRKGGGAYQRIADRFRIIQQRQRIHLDRRSDLVTLRDDERWGRFLHTDPVEPVSIPNYTQS